MAKIKKEKEEKQPKAKKEKPEKASSFSGLFKKKTDGEDGLDILTEVKEPFSFSSFFETQVVERAKNFKRILQDKGVLFFLLSPFQAKNRLVAQLMILVLGVMFGVVPRASSMVSALQNQAYQSEIYGLTQKSVGSVVITPAASSNYKRMHMLAFVVEGKNLPSDASKYDVRLAKGYGASDWQDVTYSWSVYPVTDTKRILLLGIDQRQQASGYGAFDLFIQVADDEKVSKYAKETGMFEITLSSAQETTKLYDRTGIHLSELTKAICGQGRIGEKEAEFQTALSEYQTVVEQAEAMPVDMTVLPTVETLENTCLANRVYRTLDDDSNTEDILKIEEVLEAPKIELDVEIKSGDGIQYSTELITELTEAGEYTSEEGIIFEAFEKVSNAKMAVIAAMENVNNEAMAWYSTLSGYKLILNQTVDPDGFPLFARCIESIEDPISFMDGSTPVETSEPDEPHGTYEEQPEEPAKPNPPVTETEEPEVPDTATESEPEEEVPEEEVPEEEVPEEQQPEEEPDEASETEPEGEADAATDKKKPAGEKPQPAVSDTTGDPADSK